MRDVLAKRRDIQRYIDEESWAISIERQAIPPDTSPVLFEYVGRVTTAVQGAVTYERTNRFELLGEGTVGFNVWVMVAVYDSECPRAGDRIVATRVIDESVPLSIVHYFQVINGAQYPHKIEAVMKERQ